MIQAVLHSVGRIKSKLIPGTKVYRLNSEVPMFTVYVFENGVLFHNGTVLPFRTTFDWAKTFPLDWDGVKHSEFFDFGDLPKVSKCYVPGMMVIHFNPHIGKGKVEVLVDKDDKGKSWVTKEGKKIPFSQNNYLISSDSIVVPPL